MLRSLLAALLMAPVIGAPSLHAQTTHVVVLNPMDFSPANLTIRQGDTVEWQNNGSIPHNVNGTTDAWPSNPEGFFSGPVASGPWTFSFTFHTVGEYGYHCELHGAPPPTPAGMFGTITVNSTVDVHDEQPSSFEFQAAYPNPFRSSTRFSFTPDDAQHVRVVVYDLVGREVAVLLDERVTAGAPVVLEWAPRDVPAGVYVYSIEGETVQFTRRVVHVR